MNLYHVNNLWSNTSGNYEKTVGFDRKIKLASDHVMHKEPVVWGDIGHRLAELSEGSDCFSFLQN